MCLSRRCLINQIAKEPEPRVLQKTTTQNDMLMRHPHIIKQGFQFHSENENGNPSLVIPAPRLYQSDLCISARKGRERKVDGVDLLYHFPDEGLKLDTLMRRLEGCLHRIMLQSIRVAGSCTAKPKESNKPAISDRKQQKQCEKRTAENF